MARRVEESDLVAVVLDLVRAGVLRDAASFAGHHVGLANGVEQTGLAVIDVAQHADDGRTRDHELRFVHRRRLGLFGSWCATGGLFTTVLDFNCVTMPAGQTDSYFLIHCLIHRGKDTHLHQLGNQTERFETNQERKIPHNDRRLDLHHFATRCQRRQVSFLGLGHDWCRRQLRRFGGDGRRWWLSRRCLRRRRQTWRTGLGGCRRGPDRGSGTGN